MTRKITTQSSVQCFSALAIVAALILLIWPPPARATSSPTITITQQPKNVTAPLGSTATFFVTVNTTSTNVIRYQWFFKNTPLIGAGTSSYTVPSVSATDTGSYYCAVSVDGGPTLNSDSASLTIASPTSYRVRIRKGAPGKVIVEWDSPDFVLEESSAVGPAQTFHTVATASPYETDANLHFFRLKQ